ncbi:MAG: fibronectin type III domain-containing protein [Candidatus Peregrinibacteria bacterium]|nr:fibronectin type III domain-containing protein [Candidatus Peregrinibacteria bacterium]
MKKILFLSIGLLLSVIISGGFASAQQADASLEIRPSVSVARNGDEFDVDIILKNPGLQNVISVRAWLDYNSNVLEGVSINTDESPFTLSAPGETEFNVGEGRAKIGRSNISGGFAQNEAKVATVRFRVKTPYALTTYIEAFDYQVSELGHTSVNIISEGFPVNILSDEPERAAIELNPGATPYGQTDTQPDLDVDVVVLPDTSLGFANLNRPQNLRVTTGPGYADLKWDASDEAELVGYNVYYGKTSGQYTRRRTVGRVHQYRIDGLHNNEVYYFAVTAYDAQSRESDYSDEVAVIINVPLSSTSPWEEFQNNLLANIPVTPQNGPLVGWLAFSAFGLGGTLAFRKKRIS